MAFRTSRRPPPKKNIFLYENGDLSNKNQGFHGSSVDFEVRENWGKTRAYNMTFNMIY